MPRHKVFEDSVLIVYEFDSYRVSARVGSSRRLIVSLAGLDKAAQADSAPVAMRRAWRSTFDRVFPDDHILFVQDARHSWFNDERGFQGLIRFIETYVADHAIELKVAIGFSMGATGAFILDSILRFNRVVALVPQAAVGVDACPWDQRYRRMWTFDERPRFDHIAPLLRDGGTYVIVLPIDVAEDVRHAAELCRGPFDITIQASRCGEHNILEDVRRKRQQDAFVCALVDGEEDLRRFGLQRVSRPTLARLDELLRDGADVAPGQDVVAFAAAHPSLLPTCLFRPLYDARLERTDASALDLAFPIHANQVCRPHELRHYAIIGWYALDHGFTWSEGRHHIIRFEVLDFAAHRETRVTLFFLPFVNIRHPAQRVVFMVNGRVREETVVKAGTAEATRLVVTLTLDEASNVVHIITPDCVSPAHLGLGDDQRPIALSFNHMLLESS